MIRKQEKKGCQNGFEFFSDSVIRSAEESNSDFPLIVVFTTAAATLMALRYAVAWMDQLRTQVRIIAPQVVPYPLPIDRPCVPPEFRVRPVRVWCEQRAIEARIEIQLCRDVCECLKGGIAPSSLVLLGVRTDWRPFTGEARLVRTLQQAGHQVLAIKNHFGVPS